MRPLRARSLVILAGAALIGAAPVAFLGRGDAFAGPAAACADLPRCTGCGCRGGPGYRGPDRSNGRKGACVGYRDIDRVCGVPPETRCTYEGLPNTGVNRACVAAGIETRSKAKARAILRQPDRPFVDVVE
jgi:hypothetical protein